MCAQCTSQDASAVHLKKGCCPSNIQPHPSRNYVQPAAPKCAARVVLPAMPSLRTQIGHHGPDTQLPRKHCTSPRCGLPQMGRLNFHRVCGRWGSYRLQHSAPACVTLSRGGATPCPARCQAATRASGPKARPRWPRSSARGLPVVVSLLRVHLQFAGNRATLKKTRF